jgi:hypothetical protein
MEVCAENSIRRYFFFQILFLIKVWSPYFGVLENYYNILLFAYNPQNYMTYSVLSKIFFLNFLIRKISGRLILGLMQHIGGDVLTLHCIIMHGS